MLLDTVAQGPTRSLSYPIYIPEEQPHQVGELVRIAPDVVDDLLSLCF